MTSQSLSRRFGGASARDAIPFLWPAVVLVGLALSCARGAPPPRTPAAEPPSAAEMRIERPAAESVPAPVAEPPRPVPPSASSPPAVTVPTIPERVRVGLATDLDRVVLPCCEDTLLAEAAGQRVAVVAPLEIEPAVAAVGAVAYRLQVAALKDERQAQGLATRLQELTALRADVVFDAGSDLYRVRVGRFETREAAEAERGRLAQSNLHDAWIVSEQPRLDSPSLRVTLGEQRRTVAGRWLEVGREQGQGIRVLGKTYRGRILIYLNDRGQLNVINEVSLEDYLRGVVPREMGPRIYDNVEALKAQAVAARTYTLKNLGEFVGEGYDICATPRCQVYGGMDSEDPVTDRAVAETAGEVLLYGGRLADSLYSSTCGGHTEDVRVVFPLKDEPYLRGVPCLEAGVIELAGDAPRGESLEQVIAGRLVPADTAQGPVDSVAGRLLRLARLAGLAVPADRLASLERRELQRYIASLFDLALDARLFVAAEDLEYLISNPPRDWSPEDLRLGVELRRSGLLAGALDRPLEPGEIDATLFHLAEFLRVVDIRSKRFHGLADGVLTTKEGDEAERHPVPASLATFRSESGTVGAAPLRMIPGDRLDLVLARGRLLAVVQQVDPDGIAFDRTSNRSRWNRFRSDDTLRELVRTRYPGFELADLTVLSRGVSGRVERLLLTASDGRREELRGLPIRWTLDLPDTLFTAKRLEPEEGESGWLFHGRGWGHGVGMCQVGAYGMAVRGHDYASILRHYYTGIELVKLTIAAGAARDLPTDPSL